MTAQDWAALSHLLVNLAYLTLGAIAGGMLAYRWGFQHGKERGAEIEAELRVWNDAKETRSWRLYRIHDERRHQH